MNTCMTMRVTSVKHTPRSCRPLLAQILSQEFALANRNNLWGFARVYILAKITLSPPPRIKGGKKRTPPQSTIRRRLLAWKKGDIQGLWQEATSQSVPTRNDSGPPPSSRQRALALAREGKYSKAIQSLDSLGIAQPDNVTALRELRDRHPLNVQPMERSTFPPHLTVDEPQVKAAITHFPKGSSPGGSQLRAQHLHDAICGTTVPAAQECLTELTRWINLLVSGKANPLISPWLCGAPLIALNKPGGTCVRPITVGETVRRLISRLCCTSVRAFLPDIFIPEGQVGVGVKGGLEAAVHAARHTID